MVTEFNANAQLAPQQTLTPQVVPYATTAVPLAIVFSILIVICVLMVLIKSIRVIARQPAL